MVFVLWQQHDFKQYRLRPDTTHTHIQTEKNRPHMHVAHNRKRIDLTNAKTINAENRFSMIFRSPLLDKKKINILNNGSHWLFIFLQTRFLVYEVVDLNLLDHLKCSLCVMINSNYILNTVIEFHRSSFDNYYSYWCLLFQITLTHTHTHINIFTTVGSITHPSENLLTSISEHMPLCNKIFIIPMNYLSLSLPLCVIQYTNETMKPTIHQKFNS